MSGFVTAEKAIKGLGAGFVTANGTWRKFSQGYVTNNGVWRKCYQAGIPFEDLPIGSLVSINLNNVPTSFILVHYGLPSEVYDESCSGAWLLMKDIWQKMTWKVDYNYRHNYDGSDVDIALNSNYIGEFDDKVQSHIKEVKIPYYKSSVLSGADGLTVKAFIPSASELCVDPTLGDGPVNEIGSCLDYFSDVPDRFAHAKRIAQLNGTASIWYTRTPNTRNTSGRYVVAVTANGSLNGNYFKDQAQGVRPMIILPSEMSVKGEPNADGSYTLLV